MTDWNAWFSRLRLGLWTDTDYYLAPTRGRQRPPLKSTDIAWLPFHGQHIFIAGETDYGKSVTERVILHELKPGIQANTVEVIGIDAQRGVELQPAWKGGYLKEFHWGKDSGLKTPEWPHGKPYELTFAEALERHVDIMYERTDEMKLLGINEWIIGPGDKAARVILIDEAGQMFRKNVPTAIKNRVIGAIDTLTYQSRKCGYVVVACTQLANIDAIPVRHGLNFGVAHRMQNPLGYYQVTRNSMDMAPLPRGVPGLAYMSGRGKRILRTQFKDRLEPLYRQEPVVVSDTRMPTDVADPYEQYQPALYDAGTIVGELEPPESVEYEWMSEYR